MTTQTTVTTRTTLAPTVAIAYDNSQTRTVDAIMNRFNMALIDSASRAGLLPISDSLYDLLVAYEQGNPNAPRMAALLIVAIENNDLRGLDIMRETSDALARLIGVYGENEYMTVDGMMEY